MSTSTWEQTIFWKSLCGQKSAECDGNTNKSDCASHDSDSFLDNQISEEVAFPSYSKYPILYIQLIIYHSENR